MLVWLLLGVGSAQAHKDNLAFIVAEESGGQFHLAVEVSVIDLARIGGKIPPDPELADALIRHALRLQVDGAPIQLPEPIQSATVERAGGAFVHVDYRPSADVHQVALDVRLHEVLGANHKTLGRVNLDGHSQYAVFDASQTRFQFGNEVPPSRTFTRFFGVGTSHVLAGFDHLLFLFALLLGMAGGGQLVKTITAFTVGHSLTLGLAVLGVVAPPTVLVEALIALSIVFVAGENIVRSEISRRWPVAAVFGLVHGFGFAGVLQDLGLDGSALAVALPGFNIGVEVGQLVAVAPVVGLALWLGPKVGRVARDRSAFVFSSLVLAAGWIWFCERASEVW